MPKKAVREYQQRYRNIGNALRQALGRALCSALGHALRPAEGTALGPGRHS